MNVLIYEEHLLYIWIIWIYINDNIRRCVFIYQQWKNIYIYLNFGMKCVYERIKSKWEHEIIISSKSIRSECIYNI